MPAAAVLEKDEATALAQAALQGIVAAPSRDEAGRRTLILTRGAWTREVPLDGVAEALEEARTLGAWLDRVGAPA